MQEQIKTDPAPFEQTPQKVAAIARSITRLLHLWRCDEREAAGLLGLSAHEWLAFSNDRAAFPMADDLLMRCGHLLGIFRALESLYQEPSARSWIKTHNSGPTFNGTTPLAYMIDEGTPGIEQVRSYLNAVLHGC